MTIQYAHITWGADNELTNEASTFESGTDGGFSTNVNCTTLFNTSVPSFVGTRHLGVTSAAGGVMSTQTAEGTGGYVTAPGLQVNVLGHVRTAVTSRSTQLDLLFYDVNGVLISTATGGVVADATGLWKRVTNSAIAPAAAAFVAIRFVVSTPGAGAEVHYLDGVMLWNTTTLVSSFGYSNGDTSATKITCPDSVQLSPTGDLDVRIHLALDGYSPAGNQSMVAKWITAGNQRSFRFYLDNTGRLLLSWSANGTAVITATSTVVASTTDGTDIWFRATLDVNNGAGGNDVRFYTSPDGVSYTQLGATVTTGGTTSIFDSTSQVEIGSDDNAANRETNMRVYKVELYNSISGSGQFADWDFSGQTIGNTTVTDTFGNVMTLAGNSYLDEWVIGAGDTFAAYLIERNDDADFGFQEIARITSLLVQQFDDYEGRRNVVATYRMRTLRQDGSLSAYTNTDTAHPIYTQCGYQFTTNEEPVLNQEHTDEPDRSYEFPDIAQEWDLYSRDYAVVFRETENRGDVFTTSLWLYMGGTPVTNNVPANLRGRQAFQAFIDLVRAQLSYVCVLDQDGNRWFAALLMDKTKAVRQMPGEKYLFPVRVRQVTATPSTPDATP